MEESTISLEAGTSTQVSSMPGKSSFLPRKQAIRLASDLFGTLRWNVIWCLAISTNTHPIPHPERWTCHQGVTYTQRHSKPLFEIKKIWEIISKIIQTAFNPMALSNPHLTWKAFSFISSHYEIIYAPEHENAVHKSKTSQLFFSVPLQKYQFATSFSSKEVNSRWDRREHEQ